jgi:Predicted permeases
MDIGNLWSLQLMMFILMAAGVILVKSGAVKPENREMLTDLMLYLFLPCNIINSFRMQFAIDILEKCALVLIVSVLFQVVCYLCSRCLYKQKAQEIRRVLQYGIIVSNAGFLGLPVAGGLYGTEGMMYASIFIIPQRVLMWSAGIACFTESPDRKTVLKKVIKHPCIVAVYIGLILLFFEGTAVSVLESSIYAVPVAGAALRIAFTALDKAVSAAGACTNPAAMLLVGMILSEIRFGDIFNDKNTLTFSGLRLMIFPGIVLAGCRAAGLDPFLTGVCVLMSGMPAGATAPVLASKYGCDSSFASKCVVASTLLSMFSIPLWGMLMGG